ncbi:MAG: hypothetical protein JXA66_04150 [Oligoflexia bacterium]|nr:hypothetical protein [Oligoflexia bacterium]
MKTFVKYIMVLIFLASCSTSKVSLDKTQKTKPVVNLSGSKLLIIKQRKMAEHYARFNYYANYTTFISELKTNLESRGIKAVEEPLSIFSTASWDDIRAMAGRHGADKILIIKESYSVDSGLNFLALGYVSIIGMYFLPGNSMKSFCEINGYVVDAASGEQLYEIDVSARSHKYVYRIGNSQNVLNTSITEAMNKAMDLFVGKFLSGVKS